MSLSSKRRNKPSSVRMKVRVYHFSTPFPTSFYNLESTPIQTGSCSASVLDDAITPIAPFASRYQLILMDEGLLKHLQCFCIGLLSTRSVWCHMGLSHYCDIKAGRIRERYNVSWNTLSGERSCHPDVIGVTRRTRHQPGGVEDWGQRGDWRRRSRRNRR